MKSLSELASDYLDSFSIVCLGHVGNNLGHSNSPGYKPSEIALASRVCITDVQFSPSLSSRGTGVRHTLVTDRDCSHPQCIAPNGSSHGLGMTNMKGSTGPGS